MRELYRLQKDEFIIALATAAALILGTVLEGILVAVLLSLIDQVGHSYRVRTRILTRDATGNWQPVPVAPGIVSAPGIIVYRFESDLFYANAGRFMEEVLSLTEQAGQPVRWIVIDASGINDIDFTAGKTLVQLRAELDRRGIGLAAVATPEGVLETIERYRVAGAPEARPPYRSVNAAIEALTAARTAELR
jgi:SulP family sulfate permease